MDLEAWRVFLVLAWISTEKNLANIGSTGD
jgi:hypothetical protein